MDNSLLNSLNEMVTLQRQQLQKMNDLTMQQAEQLNMQKQQNLAGGNFNRNMQFSGSIPYQAYAPQYMPPMLDPAGNIRPQAQQFQSYAKGLSGKGSNYGFIDTFMPNENVSYEMNRAMTQDFAGRSANAAIAGMGTVASAAATAGMYGLGLVPGLVGGAVAGPLVGAYFNNALEQAQVQSAYSKYLQRESYRFINPTESNNRRGYGGFSLNESQQMADFLRTVNNSFHITDTDMSRLLSSYTESGMLREVKDMETFRDKIKELTKSVKVGATVLNETYESISSLMAEMKKMGINSGNYTDIMNLGKVVGTNLGISGSEATRFVLGTAGGLTQGTGLSNTMYTGRVADTLILANHMYESLENQPVLDAKGSAALNFINNNGGVTGVSSMINQMQDAMLDKYKYVAAGFYNYNSSNNTWEFDQDEFNRTMSDAASGKADLNNLHDRGIVKLNNAGSLASLDWQNNAHLYLGNELNQLQISRFTNALARANSIAMGADPNNLDVGLSNMMPNLSADQRALYASYLGEANGQGEKILLQQDNIAAYQNLMATAKMGTPTLWGDIKYGFKSIGDELGAWGADVSNAFSNLYQNINDSLYGKQFTDLNFSTDTAWTVDGIHKKKNEFYDAIIGTQDALKTLKGAGYDISDSTINMFDVPDSMSKTYSYMRKVFENGEEVYGKKDYDMIKDIAGDNGLSETIVGALLKFSDRPEAKKLFGANEDIIEQIAKSNPSVYDPNASIEDKLKMASDAIEKLVGLYGGNEDLAMKAFFGGQQNVDDQLRAKGYDIDKLRKYGNQDVLGGVNSNDIVINNTNYHEYQNNVRGGYNPEDHGVDWKVEGNPLADGALWYEDDYDYTEGSKLNGKYYDMIHSTAEQIGISPNLLASMIRTESGGDPSALGRFGDSGLTQVMPYMGWRKEYFGRTIDVGNGETYVIGSDVAGMAANEDPNAKWSEALRQELKNPYVAAYIGADLMKKALNNSTTDDTENPFLAYAFYNGGSGYTDFLREASGLKGWDYNKLTADDIKTLSYEFAGKINGHGLSVKNILEKGDNNTRFRDDYLLGLIDPTSIIKKDVENQAKIENDKVYRDAFNNAIKSQDSIDKAFDIMGEGSLGSSVLDFSDVKDIFNQYGTARRKMSNVLAAPRTGAGNGIIGNSIISKMNDYEKEVLKNNSLNEIYLTKDMEDKIILQFLQANGSDIGGVDELNAASRTKGLVYAEDWYNKQYEDIQNFILGKKSNWKNLNIGDKMQISQEMLLLDSSNLGEHSGGKLSLESFQNLVGEDFLLAFSPEERETMSKINKKGVYSEDNKAAKDTELYKNTLKWLSGGSSVDTAGFLAKTDLVGFLNMTPKELSAGTEAITKDVSKEIVESESNINSWIRTLEDMKGEILPGLSAGDTEKMLAALQDSDASKLRGLRGKAANSAGGEGMAAELDKLVQDVVAKNAGYSSINQAESANKAVQEAILMGGDLAKVTDALSTLYGYNRFEDRKFKGKVGYDDISDSDKMQNMTSGEVLKNVERVTENIISDLAEKIKANPEKFAQIWSQFYDPELTNAYIGKSNLFTVAEDGSFQFKGKGGTVDYQAVAEQLIAVITAEQGFSDEDKAAQKNASNGIEDASKKLSDSADTLLTATDKFYDAVTRVDTKADNLELQIQQMNNNPLSRIITGFRIGGNP